MRPLTPKQQAFVLEYLKDLNATQAATRAGYSEKTAKSQGQRLLTNVDVQSATQAAMDARSKRVEVTSDFVLKNIIEIGQRCLQRDPVFIGKGKDRKQLTTAVVDPDTGDEVQAQVFQFDAQGALRANELLGKHLKLFTDKVEHSGQVQIVASPLDEKL